MAETVFKTVDCTSENCLMPLVNTRKAIMEAEPGDIIRVIGSHPQSFLEIPMALDAMGLKILEKGNENGNWHIIFTVS